MARLMLAYFLVITCGVLGATVHETSLGTRQPRHLKQKLCSLLGLCGGGFGNQGYGGYQGYPPYNQGYPPINIGVSQSQTSAAGGGGFYGGNYPSYPNNYQYNGNFGYPGGFNPYNGGYPNGPGYNPEYFGNGYGSNNNQFNGNYYGPRPGPGPYGGYFDEETSEPVNPVKEEDQEDDYHRSAKDKDK